MRWEETVFALFDDLEMQAEGLHLEQRAGEIEALSDAGYAEVGLASRVHASRGNRLRLALVDGTEVRGLLSRVGSGWVLLDAGSSEWLVPLPAVTLIDGAAESSMPLSLWSVVARLSIRFALRRISGADGSCIVRLVGGHQVVGTLGRVGADFVEMRTTSTLIVIPTAAIVAVQGER